MKKPQQNKNTRPLSESILRVCLVFAICLSLGVGFLGFATYTRGMVRKYRTYLKSILTYAAANIDGDDLEQCIETLTKSPAYEREQIMLNELKDTHEIKYIYIMKPLAASGKDNMFYVMTGVTKQESIDDPNPTTLGALSGDEYDPKVSGYYITAIARDGEVSYFANRSAFGYMYTGMIPIRNSAGESVAILSVDITIQEMAIVLGGYILVCLLGCMSFSSLFLWMLYRWMKRRVIIPVQQMEESARLFVAESHSDAGPEKLHFRVPEIYTGDEIQSLSDTLCKMSDDVKTYMSDMLTQTREKERIASELNVATQIQADMLPSIFPPFPDKNEFDIYAIMNPAKEVGGDFYDFFLVDDTHLAMVMADVSGKGVPAALFMVIAKTLIKNRAQAGGTPSEILADVNNQLCEGNKSQLFVTVWLAIIDITTGKGVAANAGHEHPVIRRAGGEYELVKYRHSPALAVMAGMPFRQHEFEMFPGDMLFVYTDGVAEATDSQNELFGTDRMLTSLNAHSSQPLMDLLHGLKEDIDGFVGDAPQFDDITMLGFHYFGKEDKQV